ncbi:MAG: hypothetical protein OXK77_11625 [Gemmatimonadota bacterium]|nr:hypothetical protein [Gemmatimonadota bacterium]MDE2866534.1 hypothetical protein [Gemmatimonadota bacterium]
MTLAEWDACVGSRGCGGYHPEDERWGRGRRPVINVNWEDVQAYVRWLRSGNSMRKPGADGPDAAGTPAIRPDSSAIRARSARSRSHGKNGRSCSPG